MREALKLALEFLEALGDNHWNDRKQAITAIKEALAQDELCSSQEPVAWFIDVTTDGLSTQDYQVAAKEYWGNLFICFPLYNTPPKRPWVGLTDEDWEPLYDKFAKHQEYGAFVSGWDNFARAIEAKLKEKNT